VVRRSFAEAWRANFVASKCRRYAAEADKRPGFEDVARDETGRLSSPVVICPGAVAKGNVGTDTMSLDESELRSHLMDLVGIRSPIVAAALLQLVVELRLAEVLDTKGLERIKEAIVAAAVQRRPSHRFAADFETEVRAKLDRLIAASEARKG